MMTSNRDLKEEIAALREQVADLATTVRDLRNLVGPMGIPMPDGSMLVQTIFGTKYCIDPMDMVIAPNLMVYRQWEPDLSRLLAAAATPDTVFVDVGAAFGYFTCLVASTVGTQGSGRVISVEPNPVMVELLRRNCEINWSMCPVDVHACALGSSQGTASLSVPRNHAANASLTVPTTRGKAAGEVVPVEVRRLDDVMPPGLAADVIKVDVEGHEWAVLQGAERVIASSPRVRIVMEWSPWQMAAAGYSTEAMLSLFARLRLRTCALPPDLVLAHADQHPLSADDLSGLTYGNVVLLRDGN